MKKLLVIILVLFAGVVQAQDALQAGFKMLENGQFAEGAAFFKNYLTNHDATHKTALLCYGRGTGLSGNVTEAKEVFAKLLERFPNDFEISLNAAEALMWGKEYPAAKRYYEKLLTEKPNDFAANLGYANALASLFEYEKALSFTNKALEIQPSNDNAKVSRKYARLGLADYLAKNQNYNQAAPLLESILSENATDKEALFAKAQLYIQLERYDESEKIYQQLLQLTNGQTEVFLNLSYLSFLQSNKTLAFDYANKAVESTTTHPQKYLLARLGRITALGWNEKFKQAFAELDSLDTLFPNNNDILIKRAGLSVWNKEFARSVSLFKKSLRNVPSSFDGNLGVADALFAQELDDESKKYVLKTLEYYPNQKDAKDFLIKLKLRHAPAFTTHTFMSSDKGGNVSKNYQVNAAFDVVTALRLNVGYRHREVSNSLENNAANVQTFTAGLRWRVKPFWLVTGAINLTKLEKDGTTTPFKAFDIANEFKVDKFQTLELRYNEDVQSFTAGLVGNQLSFKNYIATYNLNTPFKLGVYSQYYYTKNSDGNTRNLLFASLYYDLMAAPVVKFGVNYQRMTFEKRMSRVYFSPFLFRSYEAFGVVENLNVPKQKFLYQISVAGGVQRIEDEAFQATYRASLTLGYRPNANIEVTAYSLYSNSATSSVVGYSYSETGIKAKWILLKKR